MALSVGLGQMLINLFQDKVQEFLERRPVDQNLYSLHSLTDHQPSKRELISFLSKLKNWLTKVIQVIRHNMKLKKIR